MSLCESVIVSRSLCESFRVPGSFSGSLSESMVVFRSPWESFGVPTGPKTHIDDLSFSWEDFCSCKDFFAAARSPCKSLGVPGSV